MCSCSTSGWSESASDDRPGHPPGSTPPWGRCLPPTSRWRAGTRSRSRGRGGLRLVAGHDLVDDRGVRHASPRRRGGNQFLEVPLVPWRREGADELGGGGARGGGSQGDAPREEGEHGGAPPGG